MDVLRYAKNYILACAINTNEIEIWNTSTKTKETTLSGHGGKIEDMDVLNDVLASVSHDLKVKLWNLTSLTFIRDLDYHTGHIKAVVFVNSEYL